MQTPVQGTPNGGTRSRSSRERARRIRTRVRLLRCRGQRLSVMNRVVTVHEHSEPSYRYRTVQRRSARDRTTRPNVLRRFSSIPFPVTLLALVRCEYVCTVEEQD